MKRPRRPTSRYRGLCLLWLLVGLVACPVPSPAQSPRECGGYQLAYFNGVDTTLFHAAVGAKRLRELASPDSTFSRCLPTGCVKESVINLLFYNPSGGLLADLKEVFQQRANEVDGNGELARRLEYLWEAIAGGGRHLSFSDQLGTVVTQFLAVANEIAQISIARLSAELTSLAGHSDTQEVLADHREQLDSQAAKGRKMLLVAHSQGNLFVNEAHDYIEQVVGAGSVEVVHIAPASRSLRGPHVLADIDVVINVLLRNAQGPESVPLANASLALSSGDLSGHGLLETYLDPARAARRAIADLMRAALNRLETPMDFPPPPTELELVQTEDTGTLFWEKPEIDMEPLACDMPGYLVWRDDDDESHFVEGEDRYYFDPYIPRDPQVCYDVTAWLRDGTESVPSKPVCSGLHVHLHITEYGCDVTTTHEGRTVVTTERIKGTASGPIGAVLMPAFPDVVEFDAYDDQAPDQTLSCPGWQLNSRTYFDDYVDGNMRQLYCTRGPDSPPTTSFTYRDAFAAFLNLATGAILHNNHLYISVLGPVAGVALKRCELDFYYENALDPDTAKVTVDPQ